MNPIKTIKKSLAINKLAKQSFLQLDKAFEDNDKKMERVGKYDK